MPVLMFPEDDRLQNAQFPDALHHVLEPLAAVQQAVEYGMTICEYEPENPAAKAYENFAKELMGNGGKDTENTGKKHIA